MFSLGWMEISIILIIIVIVVGPKEIPTVIKFLKSIKWMNVLIWLSMLVISFTIWYNLLKLMFGIITKESV